ncbi:MAG TPA: hypothetical protein VNT26_07245, partial [Candidatus Sulfotelmatobacter sp.]|nr:hypothetical protein [Candidatus Sulfotelmatobacter sp.]
VVSKLYFFIPQFILQRFNLGGRSVIDSFLRSANSKWVQSSANLLSAQFGAQSAASARKGFAGFSYPAV